MAVYLVGYMASGKSTVGRLLARKLGWVFVDLDEAFETLHGLTTGEAIKMYGVDHFRQMEKDTVERVSEMATTEHIIYATGGGYPTYADNMECLAELGTSIYLRWSVEDLVERLYLSGFDNRPLLDPYRGDRATLLQFVRRQLAEREPYYRKATYTIDAPLCDDDADDAAGSHLRIENDEELADELFTFIQNYV